MGKAVYSGQVRKKCLECGCELINRKDDYCRVCYVQVVAGVGFNQSYHTTYLGDYSL